MINAAHFPAPGFRHLYVVGAQGKVYRVFPKIIGLAAAFFLYNLNLLGRSFVADKINNMAEYNTKILF
jgi:hypothetical protein